MTELVRTKMSRRECEAAGALSRVTYLPGSWAKRFARSMAAEAVSSDAALTERQREMLWRQVVRFRRQIADKSLVAYAENIVAAAKKAEANA